MTKKGSTKRGYAPKRGSGVSHSSCSKKRTLLKARIRALEQRMLHVTMLLETSSIIVMQEEE